MNVNDYRIEYDAKLALRWGKEFAASVKEGDPYYVLYVGEMVKRPGIEQFPNILMHKAIGRAMGELLYECEEAMVNRKSFKVTHKDVKARTFDILRDNEWLLENKFISEAVSQR
jgi:hypothetical protein